VIFKREVTAVDRVVMSIFRVSRAFTGVATAIWISVATWRGQVRAGFSGRPKKCSASIGGYCRILQFVVCASGAESGANQRSRGARTKHQSAAQTYNPCSITRASIRFKLFATRFVR
jgi:hypothetical protein